jgi:hypothetical protein
MNREDRLARNEVLFREVNERIGEVTEAAGESWTEFLCECAVVECKDVIALTMEEYEAVRADPTTFAVARGHELREIEDVIRETERFNLVRKHEDESEIARRTDPRSR